MQTKPITSGFSLIALFLFVATAFGGCVSESQAPAPEPTTPASPHVMADSAVDAGRYLAIVAGCNDCHTPGYLQTNGQVPEEEWFTGSIVGWRGPWGTTYASNLRLRASEVSEDDWVDILHYRTDLPPMPWMNVNQMSASDARAVHQYLVSLGPKGEHMPPPLPPGEEPSTPWISLQPQNMQPAPQG